MRYKALKEDNATDVEFNLFRVHLTDIYRMPTAREDTVLAAFVNTMMYKEKLAVPSNPFL